MYLSYEEYEEYGGTLDDTAFTDLEYEAASYIDWYTFNRLHGEVEIPDAVKRCVYAIIKLISAKQDMLNAAMNSADAGPVSAGITSQSNDGVSISYNVLSAKDVVDMSKNELEEIVQRYLQGIRNELGHRLLFRGLYPGEVVK